MKYKEYDIALGTVETSNPKSNIDIVKYADNGDICLYQNSEYGTQEITMSEKDAKNLVKILNVYLKK